MSKVLKILIILMLLLAVTALVFSVLLFGQRETLLGRTIKFEDAAAQIAKAVRYEDLNAENLMDYQLMGNELSKLATHGDAQYNDLQDTKADLAQTRTELDNTKTELASTQNELGRTRDDLAAAEATIVRKDEQIEEVTGQLADSEQQKEQLLVQVDELENEINEANDMVAELNDTVTMLDNELKKKMANDGDILMGVDMKPGLAGKVLVVKEGWNFVVLDLGTQDDLVVNAEMMVHRGEDLIGKVRVTSVEDNMAIADIMREWEQGDVQEGDSVLYEIL